MLKTNSSRWCRPRVLGICLLLAATGGGQAADNVWLGSIGGLWRTDSQWSAGQPPTISSTQIFVTNLNSKTITVDAATADVNLLINQFTIAAPAGATNTLYLSDVGPSRPLRAQSAFVVGPGGRLDVTGSALRVGGSAQAQLVISNGTINLDSGSIETVDNIMRVGYGAAGLLSINGGTVVAGTNLQVGASSNGNGQIFLNQGTLNVLRRMDVGDNPRSTGAVVMAGGTLLATNAQLTASIGDEGKGSLAVSNGAVLFGEMVVGRQTKAVGTVFLTGGTLEVIRRLTIGQNSQATGAVVVTGGELVVTNKVVGSRIGDTGVGSLTIQDGLARLSDVSVGRSTNGFGTLTLLGGTIRSADISIGRAGATGAVYVAGGTFHLGSDVFRIGRETVGTMAVSNGNVQASAMYLGLEALSEGTLTIAGGVTTLSSILLAGQTRIYTNAPSGFADSHGTFLQTAGAIFITNSTCSGTLEIRIGTGTQRGGTSVVDQLVLTNTAGTYSFTGGRLEVKSASVDNGQPFRVGVGTDAPALFLRGGTNTFAAGLEIAANASVAGSGRIDGNVINRGQILAAGSGQTMIFTAAVTNYGTMRSSDGGYFEFLGPVTNFGTISNERPLKITGFTAMQTAIRISFNTRSGLSYTVQKVEDLPNTSWMNVTTVIGDGTTNTVTLPGATGLRRFYRVVTP